ncbi:Checkpoint kinase 2 [Dinochytrium kinnereticum]|nr:Checkpoint kinase 2 [Dinochytrium kinnereticum]
MPIFYNLPELKDPESPFQKRYDVRHELGRGNFATVKLAVDKQTGERCAVKIIERRRFSMNAKLLASFNREMEILKSLSHPNIVGYRNHFEEKGIIYLVQELVPSGDLLHKKHITHRDLKPDNFLIAENGTLKLADFGLAKGQTGVLNTVCGTPVYLAPEILKNASKKAYDNRVDLYSSGVILFYLLSGKVPFNATSQTEIFHQIQRGGIDWSDPSWITCSSEALDIILRLMHIDPEKRISLAEVEKHQWIIEGILNGQSGTQGSSQAYLISCNVATASIELKFNNRSFISYGRMHGCDIVASDRRISSHHCRFVQEGPERILLFDLSSNGVTVNKLKDSGKIHGLKSGDLISFAPPNDGAPNLDYRLSFTDGPVKHQLLNADHVRTKRARLTTGKSLYILKSLRPSIADIPIPPSGKISVGRLPGCDIVLTEPAVSGLHCIVTNDDGLLRLEDLRYVTRQQKAF